MNQPRSDNCCDVLRFVVLVNHLLRVNCVPGPPLVGDKVGVIPFGGELRAAGSVHFLTSGKATT